jgi:hypothetical protein
MGHFGDGEIDRAVHQVQELGALIRRRHPSGERHGPPVRRKTFQNHETLVSCTGNSRDILV